MTPVESLGDGALSRLGQQMIRQSRTMHAMKAAVFADAPADVDPGALSVLFHLVRGGVCRQGTLAEGSLLDPSTVSRHVAALVRGGLVERRPDPADGRAVVLAATEAGETVVRGMTAARDRMLRVALQDWSEDDLDTLAALMSRMNDDFDTYRHSLPATTAPQHARAGAAASRTP